jgi:DNA mismatch repair protein MutS2
MNPEALVELNNRRKRAEIAIEQEVLRILRELSRRTADAAPEIEVGLRAATDLDCAFARARLSRSLDARAPEVGRAGIIRLPQLRHPLLVPSEVVPNNVALGEGITTLVI